MADKTYLKVGYVVGDRWKVVQEIGQGGMSNVYLVQDLRMNTYLALKEVPFNNTPDGRTRFQAVFAETNLLKSLSHRSIPRIWDVVKTDRSLLIIMEYVNGRSLRDVIKEQHYIDERYIVKWGISLCKTLKYLHNHTPKVIFRDMKPHNVMLNNEGDVILLDFGIARAITDGYDTSKTARLGTKGYAAPEQAAKPAWFDERSDIFALGRTLYFLASNHNPSDSPEKIRPIREWDRRRSVGLEKIILKATQRNPEHRYQSVEEMLYDLEHIHEMSDEYRNGLAKKFYTVVGLASTFVLGMALIGGGIISQSIGDSVQYETHLETGRATGNLEELSMASRLQPEAVEPYVEMVKLYKEDTEFTLKEEVQLLGLLQPNLYKLKGKDGAGDLLYQIGQLYWYYYKDNGQIKSVSWFEQAFTYGVSKENNLLLDVYLRIGSFKKGILSSITDESDAGLYKSYWKALTELRTVMSGDNKLELLYLQGIFDVIDSYSGGLKTDGFEREELEGEFNQAVDYLDVIVPKTDKELSQVDALKERVENVRTKLNTAYGKRF